MDAGELRARRRHDRHRRASGSPSDDTTRAGLHPRRLPPHRRPGRGARRDDHRRAAARPRRSTSRCPRDVVLERLAGRRVCRRLRHELLGRRRRRAHDWTCDVCGGEVVQRDDDTEEAITRRLDALRAADRAAHRLVHERRPAGDRRRRRRRPTTCSAGSSRRSMRRRRARTARTRRVPVQRSVPTELADDAAGRPGRGRDARRASATAIRPGVTTAELDQIGREVLDRRGARSNFLGYHGLPGGDLRVAQRRDRPRHPRRRTASRRATSSRSTAGRSSTAGTATPPSPPPVGEVDRRGRTG